jgi:hypothetical protein
LRVEHAQEVVDAFAIANLGEPQRFARLRLHLQLKRFLL